MRFPHTAFERLGVAALVLHLASGIALVGCGDDDDDDPEERIAAACEETCGELTASCDDTQAGAAPCSDACKIAGSLALDCADSFEGFVSCAGDNPVLSCGDDSVTVSGAATECVEPLAAYLTCAAESVLDACIAVPSEDSACQNEGLGRSARICTSAPDGCELFEGSLRADGIGLFCCG